MHFLCYCSWRDPSSTWHNNRPPFSLFLLPGLRTASNANGKSEFKKGKEMGRSTSIIFLDISLDISLDFSFHGAYRSLPNNEDPVNPSTVIHPSHLSPFKHKQHMKPD
jgi:hypothetical protein